MKRCCLFLFVLISISLVGFVGCKSVPVEEPVVEEPVVEEPVVEEPVVEEPVVEESVVEESEPIYDWSLENEDLIAQINDARVKAFAAGAELYQPNELSVIDDNSSSIQSDYAEGGEPESFNTKAKNVVNLYKALEQASFATERYERINGFGFAEYDKENYDIGNKASTKGAELFTNGATDTELLEVLTLAAESYKKVLDAAFTQKANEERVEVVEIKKQADSIKAGVASKEAYNNAVLFFTNGDKLLKEGDSENAYKSFSESFEDFTSIFKNVTTKREVATVAIQKAKQRIEESHAKAVEADFVAPIEEVDPKQAAAQNKGIDSDKTESSVVTEIEVSVEDGE